jgi:undecaprenyl-diphosphatase
VAALFCFLGVLAVFYDRFPADERIAHAIQGIDVTAFGGFMDFTNVVGDGWVSIPIALACTLAFAFVRAGWEALLVLLSFVPRVFNGLLKEWVERPRPSDELVQVTSDASGYSFPSGHVVGTAVLFGLLFFLIPVLVRWRTPRWALQFGCLLMVLAAGPARVYVGVHWPSDALGGYLLALLFLLPALMLYHALHTRR